MWDKPQALWLIANLIFATTAAMVLYATLSWVVRLPQFALREVRVEGRIEHVTADDVDFIVKRRMRGNFFTVDLAKVRSDFEKLPWVRTVSVRRVWPMKLQVRIDEHVALARWDSSRLVNTFGEVYEASTDQPLPVFSAPEGSSVEVAQEYARFAKSLAPIGEQIAAINLSARKAWQIRLQNDMVIELGRERVERRLDQFVANYEQTVGKMNGQVGYVDLRYDNGFAVRVPGFEQKTGGGEGKRRVKL